MGEEAVHLQYLWEVLARRQKANPSYSLRAFARDLGIQPPTLSAILKKKRSIPRRYIAQFLDRLELSPEKRRLFIESFSASKRGFDPQSVENASPTVETLNEELHYQAIAEWEYYAVLSLFETRTFKPQPEWIAQRLNISEARAKVVWQHLLQLGLVQETKDQSFEKVNKRFKTTEDIVSLALQKSHEESTQLALAKLRTTPVTERDYSSVTVAVNPKKINEAKSCIRKFRREMEAILEKGEKTEVYQVSVQFFPLTEIFERKTGSTK